MDPRIGAIRWQYGGIMVNVAQVVSAMIRKKPFIEEALVREIVNYAYLADMIQPEVEKALRRKVNRYAIIMALRRLKDQLKDSFVGSAPLQLKNSEIAIISDVFEVTVAKSPDNIKKVSEIYRIVDFSRGDFLTVTQGLYEITLISNAKYRNRIVRVFGEGNALKIIGHLASLIVRISPEESDSLGLLYNLTKALSWENINIAEVVSTFTEEIFMIDEDDAPYAFNAIKSLVKTDKPANDE